MEHGHAAAASLAVKEIIARVRDAGELETAITAQTREPNGSLVVMPDTFTTLQTSAAPSVKPLAPMIVAICCQV